MTVSIKIIEVNMFSPKFVPNSQGINFCDTTTYKAKENTIFKIEVSIYF